MKRISIIACILVLLLSMIPLTVNATMNCTYTAKYGTPTVDGVAEDLWEGAEWTYVGLPHDGEDSSNSIVQVKLLWDENHLYFLTEVMDSNRNVENDIFEIYLDQLGDMSGGYGEDDSQTRFALSGTVVTGEFSGTNAQTDAVFKVTAHEGNVYILEGALSWVNTVPAVGMTMGLEFMYNDAAQGNDFVEAYRWNADTANGDPAPWASTAAFGTLIFADAEGNTENMFEKNNAELLAELKAMEVYSELGDINADNIVTVKAAIAAVEEKISALTGDDAILIERYTENLKKAKTAVEAYDQKAAEKAQAIQENQALYDAIKALKVTGINGSNYKAALAAYEEAKKGYDGLPSKVKTFFREDDLDRILRDAKAALDNYVPTKAEVIAEHQELYNAIKALTTDITAENYESALAAYNAAYVAYDKLDKLAVEYFEEDGLDDLLEQAKAALDDFDPDATVDPEKPAGCSSVLSVGAGAMMLLFGAWVALCSRKREY